MTCDELRHELPELLDDRQAEPRALEFRLHLDGCGDCAREVARHRQAWRLLAEIDDGLSGREVPAARLVAMADAVLAQARPWTAPTTAAPTPATERPLRRLARARWPRVAVAAALVAAVTVTAVVRNGWFGPGPGAAPDDALPAFLLDPEFVSNFEVIRDLPELDRDGDLLDVDDDALVMQVLDGA